MHKKENVVSDASVIPDTLPGLDVKEGVRRLGGIWSMYADLVIFFCDDKKDFYHQINSLIEKKDFKSAAIIAHSLKGSAATISATNLSNAAKNLEEACENEDLNQITEILKVVKNEFAQIMAASKTIDTLLNVKTIVTPDNFDASECESSRLSELFHCLSQSLLKFDPLESEHYVNKLRNCFASGRFDDKTSALFEDMSKLISSYEFKAARKILHEITDRI